MTFFETALHDGVVVVTRTACRYESTADIESAFAETTRWVNAVGASGKVTGLIIDLRQVVGRNDPAFESVIAPHRAAMYRLTPKNAVVVKTATGALQVKRHLEQDGVIAEVFTDLDEALTSMTQGGNSSAPADEHVFNSPTRAQRGSVNSRS